MTVFPFNSNFVTKNSFQMKQKIPAPVEKKENNISFEKKGSVRYCRSFPMSVKCVEHGDCVEIVWCRQMFCVVCWQGALYVLYIKGKKGYSEARVTFHLHTPHLVEAREKNLLLRQIHTAFSLFSTKQILRICIGYSLYSFCCKKRNAFKLSSWVLTLIVFLLEMVSKC